MISKEEAIQIKKQYLALTPLERIGIDSKTALSKGEKLALSYINNSNTEQAAKLMLYLDDLEKILDDKTRKEIELSSDPELKKDLKNLRKHGINPSNKEIMYFVYELIHTKLNGQTEQVTEGESKLKDIAKIKALEKLPYKKIVKPSPKPDVLTDDGLRKIVEENVRNVEKYLTAYFSCIKPLLEHFLPLEVNCNSKKIQISHSNDFSKEGQNHYSILSQGGYIDRLERRILPWAGLDKEWERDRLTDVICELIGDEYNYFRFEGKEFHDSLKSGLFGESIDLQTCSKIIKKRKESRIKFYFKDKYLFAYLLGGKKQKAANIIQELFGNQHGQTDYKKLDRISKNEGFDSCSSLLQFLGDFVHPIFYNLNYKDCSYLEYAKKRVNSAPIAADTYQIKLWTIPKIEKTEPLFVFRDFDSDAYSLNTYKQFWESLSAYAQLPEKITYIMCEAFKDNYMLCPGISLEEHVLATREKLKELAGVINEVKAQGHLESLDITEQRFLPYNREDKAS